MEVWVGGVSVIETGGYARAKSQGQESRFGLWLCICMNLTNHLD